MPCHRPIMHASVHVCTWFSHRHFGAELHFHMFCVTLILLRQISIGCIKYHINTDKCTHVLLGRHFINNIRYSNMFHPLRFIFRERNWYILAAWVNKMSHLLLECINYAPWRWPLKGWNMLELRIVLIGVLLMYECICRYLFDMVIFVHGYKLDKINRVIKSRRMKSAVYGTQTIYI